VEDQWRWWRSLLHSQEDKDSCYISSKPTGEDRPPSEFYRLSNPSHPHPRGRYVPTAPQRVNPPAKPPSGGR
jgi:hypothetical protein